jgi:hypothetical protein
MELVMQANTLQVRKVMRAAIKQHDGAFWRGAHSWTEKTTHKIPAQRSIVMCVDTRKAAAVLATVKQQFALLNYSNKVKTTQDMYLRCIAHKA